MRLVLRSEIFLAIKSCGIWSLIKDEGKVGVGCRHYVSCFDISAFTLREIRFDVIRVTFFNKLLLGWLRLNTGELFVTDVSIDIADCGVDVLAEFVCRFDTGSQGRSAVNSVRVHDERSI